MKTLRDNNPLAARQSDFVAVIEPGDAITPNQIIQQNALVFSGPVVCMVDEGFWLRADWDSLVPVASVVRFIETPQGDLFGKILGTLALIAVSVWAPYALGITSQIGAAMLSAGIMIAGSFLLGLLFPAKTTGEIDSPDTAYALSNSNRMRPGEPFAERFGRRIFYPDVAMSFTRFENNEQYLYMLLVVGVGYYDDIVATIGKTLLSDYSDVTYNTLQPGIRPSICSRVIWTSTEVSSQEIDTDWINYVVNPRGTEAYSIEYDVTFAAGLVRYNDSAKPCKTTVHVQARFRTVDAYGNATSSWTTAAGKSFTAASKDPLRYTMKVPAPFGPGRYEFGIRRVIAASTSGQTSDKCIISGLRGSGGAHPAVSGVTMWETKLKATKQMNGESGSKIQLEATRMLHPVTATGFGEELAATRCIVDACAYMVTSDNGGRFNEAILAWDVLAELKTDFASAGYLFDYGFTTRMSVMDACSKAAACGSAVAYTPGGLFCLAANTQQVAYGVAFTDDDYDPESLKITTTFRTPDSYTCVRVSYYDPESGQEETVDCYEAGGGTLNPKEVNLEGCTSRQQAWEIGLLLYRDLMLSTVNVEFVSGLKGNLPSLFSWIPVASNAANWNQTGVIAAVESGGIIWTSEPLDFEEEDEGWMLLIMPDGATAGPYVISPTSYPHKHLAAIPDTLYTIKDNDLQATRYIFGPTSKTERLVRVMAIAPEGRDKISLTGQVVVESIYDDFGTAPGFDGIELTTDPLTMVTLALQSVDTAYNYYAAWAGVATSFLVEVDEGSGFSTLQDDYAAYSLAFSSSAAMVTVRVTPYVTEVLASEEAMTASYEGISAPTNLSVTTSATGVTASWDAVVTAESYQVELYVDDASVVLTDTTAPSISVTTAQLTLAGGPWASFSVHVRAINEIATSEDATYLVGVAGLAAPTGLALQTTLASAIVLSWGSVEEATGYKLYLGTTAGFDPATSGTLVYSGTTTAATITVDLTAPYTYYFKVAAVDIYRQDPADLSFSAALLVGRELTVAPDAPANLSLVASGSMGTSWMYIAAWSDVVGATGYRVHIGDSSFFDPATEGVLVRIVESPSTVIALESVLGSEPTAPVYVRVASVNEDNPGPAGVNYSSGIVFPGTAGL